MYPDMQECLGCGGILDADSNCDHAPGSLGTEQQCAVSLAGHPSARPVDQSAVLRQVTPHDTSQLLRLATLHVSLSARDECY